MHSFTELSLRSSIHVFDTCGKDCTAAPHSNHLALHLTQCRQSDVFGVPMQTELQHRLLLGEMSIVSHRAQIPIKDGPSESRPLGLPKTQADRTT